VRLATRFSTQGVECLVLPLVLPLVQPLVLRLSGEAALLAALPVLMQPALPILQLSSTCRTTHLVVHEEWEANGEGPEDDCPHQANHCREKGLQTSK